LKGTGSNFQGRLCCGNSALSLVFRSRVRSVRMEAVWRLAQPDRGVRTLLPVTLRGATKTVRTSTKMVTSRRTNLTSTVRRVLFQSRRAEHLVLTDLADRDGRVAEGVVAAVVGQALVPVPLRAAAIGKVPSWRERPRTLRGLSVCRVSGGGASCGVKLRL
jgi:hypothetical protein